jgi:hypothetical protein
MSEAGFPYELSAHASQRIEAREIDLEWVERTISQPTLSQPHPTDEACTQVYRVIPEAGDKVLKVIYNHQTEPLRIVTVHFDRGMRGKL